jgi:hypothetical protein
MSNVIHDAVQGSNQALVIFISHGYDDEQFGTAMRVVMHLSESVALTFEVVWVACGR